MKYTVLWLPNAMDELASVWMAASDRDAVSLAVARIDRVLGAAPLEHGESREEEVRVLFSEPLGVEHKIDEGDRKVQVTTVWHMR